MFPVPDRFLELAFPDLELGDQRLDKRLGHVAAAMLRHPEKPLPDKFLNPNDYFAALDFLNHPAVTHATFLNAHQIALLERLEDRGPEVVLFLHDTTELDFTGHTTLHDHLGQIGNGGGRGWLCHNSLAVDPARRQIFGLAHQILHARPVIGPGEPVARKRERADRESRLWLQALDEIGPAPDDRRWIHIADRGADTFEFLHALFDRRQHFVIRSTHNRALVLSADALEPAPQTRAGEPETELESTRACPAPVPHLLHDRLRTLPSAANWTVWVGATRTRPSRETRVEASYCQVPLRPPHVRRGNYRKEAVPVWAVRVWEAHPPVGEEALEWFLLTDQSIGNADALRTVVGWYECRPLIEEFHKGQKTGVGIEKLQLQDPESLRASIALMSVVALALVNLRVAHRDPMHVNQRAADHVPEAWVRVLSIWRVQEVRDLTVGEFTLALARLGGHLNRKSDGPPGWITLWRGWERLHTMLDFESSRAKCT